MKLKHIDNYTWSILLLIIGVILISKYEKPLIGSIVSILSVILLSYTGFKGSGEIVINDYDGELAIKTKNGREPEIFTGKILVDNIDGAATAFNKKKVFKLHNGIKAKVLKTGELKETTWIAMLINTGYTSSLKTDENWKPLYEYANKL